MGFRKLGKDQKVGLFRPLRFRSMAPDVDPQRLPENQAYLEINARHEGGIPIIRGGQRHIVNLDGGQLTGLGQHTIGTNRSLFLVGDGCPGESAGAGSYLGVLDQELRDPSVQSPTSYQNATFYGTAANTIVVVEFNEEILFALDTELKKFSLVDSLQETRLVIPTPTYTHISAMVEHEGTLLLALVGAGGPGTSAIFTFDGTTLTNVDTTLNEVTGFGIYNNKAIAFFGGAPNTGRVRSADGTFSSTGSPGGGTLKMTGNNAASFRDALYVPGGDTDIFRVNYDMTVTQIPAATNNVPVGAHITSCVTFNGALYYLWHDAAEATVYIGKFDGTTWDHDFKNLTLQGTWPAFMNEEPAASFLTSFEPGISRCMRLYRNGLVVGAIETGPGVAGVYFSPGFDVDGVWTRLLMSTGFATSDITEMVTN